MRSDGISHKNTTSAEQPADFVEIVAYDPRWPEVYRRERARLIRATGDAFSAFEHIGSTAVHGLAAKPIIDMMVAVSHLKKANALLPTLDQLGYRLIDTGMRNRLFFHRQMVDGIGYNLHIVEAATWDDRKERHLRDFLIANPAEARAYGALKERLARGFRNDSLGYTKAKTAFIQRAFDTIREAQGLPRVDVWED